jgi:hypothetical protein
MAKHDYPACAIFRGGKCTCDEADNFSGEARYRFLLGFLIERGVLTDQRYRNGTWCLRGIYGVDDSGLKGAGRTPEEAIDNAIVAANLDPVAAEKFWQQTHEAIAGQQSERPEPEVAASSRNHFMSDAVLLRTLARGANNLSDEARAQLLALALDMPSERPAPEKEADAVDALTEMGWIWDGDQWQRPAPVGQAVSILETVGRLMRNIDAYAHDYADDGKFAKSRVHVERELRNALAASQAERPAVKEDKA